VEQRNSWDIGDDTDAQFVYGLGAVVLSGNYLEVTAATLLAWLTGGPRPALNLPYGRPFKDMTDECRKQISFLPDSDLRDEVAAAVAEAQLLYEQRNGAAHAFWIDPQSGDKRKTTIRLRRSSRGQQDRTSWSFEDLMKLADDLVASANRVRPVRTPLRLRGAHDAREVVIRRPVP